MKILQENNIGKKFFDSFAESLPQNGYDAFYSAFEDFEKLVRQTKTGVLGCLLDRMLIDTMAWIWMGVVVTTKRKFVGWICSLEPNYL
jgi:hypothetical protein